MKKLIFPSIIIFFLCGSALAQHTRGSGFNEGILDMQKYPIQFDKLDAAPSDPPCDEMFLYARASDDTGDTALHMLDCLSTETELGAASAGGGSSLFTDSGTSTFLTSTTDDFIVGSTIMVAPFSVDVSTNTVRVGEGNAVNAVLDMYASDGDTGSITYNTNDAWAFEGGNIGIGTTDPDNPLVLALEEGVNTQNKGLSVQRDGGYIVLGNGTSNTTIFQPTITGQAGGFNTFGLKFRGVSYLTDSPGAALVQFQATNSTINGPIADGFKAIEFSNFADVHMIIMGDGQIGMGTTDPKTNLHVYEASPSADQELFKIGTIDDTSRFVVDEDGDLDMDGTFATNGQVTVVNSGFTPATLKSAGGDSDGILQLRDGTSNVIDISLWAGGNDSYINVANLGIGTSTPTELLTVAGTTNTVGLTVTGTFNVPNSTTLPSFCNPGDLYQDTDATSGQQVYACESGSFVLQGDGNSGGTGLFTDGGSSTYLTSVTDDFLIGSSQKEGSLFIVDVANGSVGIGTTSTLDSFNVADGMDLTHTATQDDDHALEIDLDAAGFGDVKAVDIVYTTGAISSGEDESVILVNIDESASTGGDVIGLEVLATEGSAEVYGLGVGVGISPIVQLSGAFEDMDSALVIAVDRLAEFISSASDIAIFVADNDTVTIGDAEQFQEIEFLLDTVASGAGIDPTFEYSTGVGTWATFSPTDGTNGMRNTGIVKWLLSDIPSWAVGTGSEYLIRITRTRNSLTTNPIEDKVQIAKATKFKWNKDAQLSVFDLTTTGTITSTSATDGWAGMTIANTTPDLTVGTTLVTLQFDDINDSEMTFLRFMSNVDSTPTVEGYFSQSGKYVTEGGVVFEGAAASANWKPTATGENKVIIWSSGNDNWVFYNETSAPASTNDAVNAFIADSTNAGMSADQEVFEVGKGSTATESGSYVELMAIDEDGDMSISGSLVLPNESPNCPELELDANGRLICVADDAGSSGTGFMDLPVESAKVWGDFIVNGTMAIDAGEGHWKLLADTTTHEYAGWQRRIPASYSSGLISKIQYTMASATSGTIELEIDMMCTSDGDSADINTLSFDTVNSSGGVTVPGTAGHLDEISITLTNNDSVAAGDLCFIKVGTRHRWNRHGNG